MALDTLCQFLEWDTAFFGYRIARVIPHLLTDVQANAIDQWCAENKIDCLYFLAESRDAQTIRIAEDNAYRHVDVRNVYEIDISKPFPSQTMATGYSLDTATTDDTQIMLPMIDNAFEHTRFYFDYRFSREQANKLYQTWLIRSIEENFADQVLVVRKQNEPQGFITCSVDRNSKIGLIGLIGVAASARGNNLGASLVSESLHYFKEQGMQRVQVVTQGRNIVGNRLYQKCGFRTSEMYLWYHKWFS